MRNNELNPFDQLLKNKVADFEVPFDSGDWTRLEQKLPKKTTPFIKTKWFWSGAAALTGLVITGAFLLPDNTPQTSQNYQASEKDMVLVAELTVPATNENWDITETPSATLENEENKTITESPSNGTNPSDSHSISNDGKTIAGTEIPKDNTIEKGSDLQTTSSTVDKPNNTLTTPAVEKPTAEIICTSSEKCEGEFFEFQSQTQKNVDYLWDFGDNTYSKEQNPQHIFEQSGSYKVNLIVRSIVDNGILAQAKSVLVHVNPKPKANFEYEEIQENGIPKISFINTTDKGSEWSWNLGNGIISSEKDPNYNYKNRGQYPVSLTATNEFGCKNTVSKNVVIAEDYNLLAPNSFTPNGDGINDHFIPVALKVMDVDFVMSIFSTTQGLLFESKNSNQQWDGINQQNGEPCSEGSYIWVVTLTNSNGTTEQYKGAVLLLK